MQQPMLGRRLTALRKEKNLTQEELVQLSNVSVRTIQRIEAGEVVPRFSTIKILLDALGQPHEQFLNFKDDSMQEQPSLKPTSNLLFVSVIAGIIYLVLEIILSVMDLARFTKEEPWAEWINFIYIGLTITMIISYTFFMLGFIKLSDVFENGLLRLGSYLMIIAILGLGVLDSSTLWAGDIETVQLPYMAASLLVGSLTLIFGIGLIRLQDGMGVLSRVAGVLEIIIGCALITVVLFFIGYVVMIPAVIIEILLLYRGYEYLSKSEAQAN